jgi:hypothetical protein
VTVTLTFDCELDGVLDADGIATAFLDMWEGSVLLPKDDDDWAIIINSVTAMVEEEAKEVDG